MIKTFFAFALTCSVCFGAVPTFNSFNNSQFSASSSQNNVSISDGADMTNTVQKTVYISGRQYIQDTLSGTNNPIDFTHYSYWPLGSSSAVRFNIPNPPTSSTNSSDCIITMVGNIGSVFTNVADSIVWLGPWGVLNATNTTVTIRWNGTNLIAWQDPMHGVATIAQWVANTDNFDAGVNDEIRVSTDAARNLTGIVGRPGGQQLTIENVGSFTITLKNNVTSTATNRFIMAQDIALGANQNITLIYDLASLRWHPIAMASVTEPNLFFSDVTTANATSSQHGLMPKLDANANHFFTGAGTQTGVAEAGLSFTDVTTANSSTSQHGLLPKLDNNAAHYLDGTGAFSTPSGASSAIIFTDNSTVSNSNSSAEFSLYTNNTAIAGNTFGTNKVIRINMGGTMTNASGSGVSYTLKLYIGGTLRATTVGASITSATAGNRAVEAVWTISEANGTAAQSIDYRSSWGPSTTIATANTADFQNSHGHAATTIDTTATLSLGITMTIGTAVSTADFQKTALIAQLLQ